MQVNSSEHVLMGNTQIKSVQSVEMEKIHMSNEGILHDHNHYIHKRGVKSQQNDFVEIAFVTT